MTVAALNAIAAASIAAVCGVAVAGIAAVNTEPWPAGGGGGSAYWMLGDFTGYDGLEISEVQLLVGGSAQTISGVSYTRTPTSATGTLFDGNNGNGITCTQGLAQYGGFGIIVTLSTAATIDGVKLGAASTPSRLPTAFSVYRSADSGVTWELYGHVLVPTGTGTNSLTTAMTIDAYTSGSYRNVRFMGWAFEDTQSSVEFNELQVYEGATRRDSGATYTTNTGSSGLSAMNNGNNGDSPTFASKTTMIASASYLDVDLGADYAVSGLRIACNNRTWRVPCRLGLYGQPSAGGGYSFRGILRGHPYVGDGQISATLSIAHRAAMAYGTVIWDAANKTTSATVNKAGFEVVEGVSSEQRIRGTVGKSSGKWQWENRQHKGQQSNTAGACFFGIVESGVTVSSSGYTSGNTIGFDTLNANISVGSSGASAGTAATAGIGDHITMLLDMDNGTLKCRINGGSLLTIATGIPAGTWYPFVALLGGASYDTYAFIGSGALQAMYSLEAGYSPLA